MADLRPEFVCYPRILQKQLEIGHSAFLNTLVIVGNQQEHLIHVFKEQRVLLIDQPLSEAMTQRVKITSYVERVQQVVAFIWLLVPSFSSSRRKGTSCFS